MADIFISYAREDEARAKEVASLLEAEGWSVFWDRRIPAGATWRQHIGNALDGARCIVVIWSKFSVESSWVLEEADEGRHRGVLVPVLMDAVDQPRGFREIQAADLSSWQPGKSHAAIKVLLADIRHLFDRAGETTVSGSGNQQVGENTSSDFDEAEHRRKISGMVWFGLSGIMVVAIAVAMIWLYFDPQSPSSDSAEAPATGMPTPPVPAEPVQDTHADSAILQPSVDPGAAREDFTAVPEAAASSTEHSDVSAATESGGNNTESPFSRSAVINDPDGYTNIRRRKTTQSEIVARVLSGEIFHTYEQTGDWWLVKTRNDKVGYMHVSRIQLLE